MGTAASSLMSDPMGKMGGMVSGMTDPQKLAAGVVGPSKAGMKPPTPPPGQLVRPTSSITPQNAGQLDQSYTVSGNGGGLDPALMLMLQQLAAGRR
jgi:hypothetical protein